ncbi:hypothetical protein M3D00_00490 [Dietzia cinnamea]|uniref:hypothetical protein n=2 Tax=Mycobacteriales TaxID=85007 RepID=UPI0021A958AD|nr:hypothetical protein [Dietzia cinnamea]MCT2028645.1 hypothetical protein [Dietzia cinnamea]
MIDNVSMDASATVAAIAAAIALAALYFTRRQVKTAEEQTSIQRMMHEEAAQPYVWADIRPHAQHADFMMLIVKNDGPTVASNVSVTIDPPFPQQWAREGEEDRFTSRRRFAALPPGRVMQWNLGIPQQLLPSPEIPANGDGQFRITICFDGPKGPADTLSYIVDLSEYRRAAKTTPGTPMTIAKSIKDSSEALTKAIDRVSKQLPQS